MEDVTKSKFLLHTLELTDRMKVLKKRSNELVIEKEVL